jgi:mycothiol synthase
MPAPLDLPEGYLARPLTAADAAAVTAVMAAQELHDVGEVVIEEADIVADWQRPGYDVSQHAVGILRDDTLVAYSEHTYDDRGDAAVHPDHRGRGLGTQLARWMQEKAREHGQTKVGMPVPRGSAGDRLLEALGYHVRWESWVLQLPAGVSIPDRPLPSGYVVRAAREEEWPEAWRVNEDAFLEWSVRERDTFEIWKSQTVLRPGFEPWQLRVVVDPSSRIVGMALLQLNEDTCYIARLAVDGQCRGLGLGQALLVDAFAVGREHGATVSELSTDSRTGALGLYEKVGMQVTSTWVNRAIDL